MACVGSGSAGLHAKAELIMEKYGFLMA